MLEKYIYIMGRGHSGSTVLDSLLGNARNACGVGEMVMGIDGTYPCSCGDDVSTCTFWKSVRESFDTSSEELTWDDAAEVIASESNVLRFVPNMIQSLDSVRLRSLGRATRTFADSISHASGQPVVVESSKEISRALFLARSLPEARILHIVRHPERMLASNLHRLRDGSGLVLFRRTFRSEVFAPLVIAASALSWVIGNLLCEIVALRFPEKVMRVRYEDLCADPAAGLERISSFTGLELDNVISAVQNREELDIDHKLAGNRMAKKGHFVFQPSRSKGRDIPESLRKIGRAITWPIMRLYEYS